MTGMRETEPSYRNILIYTISVVCGLAVVFRPDILKSLPQMLQILLSSGITTGAIVAIILNLILPGEE